MSDHQQDLSAALKKGMRLLASGVCVITGKTQSGERVAMTASSVTSVSDNPPSLLVCVNKEAKMDAALAMTEGFTVNVLSKEHEHVSNTCAKPSEGDNRFNSGNWALDDGSGLYHLADALTVFICEKKQVVPYGTHNIYIGDISKVIVSENGPEILVYANGAYHYL
ncbi:MAG: flavin reductase [Lentisphaeria bacterium]|jgi:flavin reductase